jgi:hypothetical protein
MVDGVQWTFSSAFWVRNALELPSCPERDAASLRTRPEIARDRRTVGFVPCHRTPRLLPREQGDGIASEDTLRPTTRERSRVKASSINNGGPSFPLSRRQYVCAHKRRRCERVNCHRQAGPIT